MSDYDNPLKWLLARLPNYIPPEQLAALLAEFEANKRGYYLALKIKDAERRIRIIVAWPGGVDVAQLAHWQAKLKRLKERQL